MGVEPVLENGGGGEGVDALAFLVAGEVAGEFAFGAVGGEVFAGAVDGDGRADGLDKFKDEAFGDFGLGGNAAVGVKGETDDDGVDGFFAGELGNGLGKLGVGEGFEHFEGEGETGLGVADGDAGAAGAVVDAEDSLVFGHKLVAKVTEDLVGMVAGEIFGGEVLLGGVGLFLALFPEGLERVVGIGGKVELVADGGAPILAAEGAADNFVEFGDLGGLERAEGVEDVVFDQDEHGVFLVAVGDGILHQGPFTCDPEL